MNCGRLPTTVRIRTRVSLEGDILNQMVQLQRAQRSDLDRTFHALADPRRRRLVERGEASITAIAEQFEITLPGARKQVKVLEEAGLVQSVKLGRTRRCRL